MKNEVKNYAWGDSVFIPELLHIDNADKDPYAELWMGAHKTAPSLVEVNGQWTALDAAVAADPCLFLGPEVASRFGRLPFLFKILSAARPLSIQAHPSKSQAEEGYRRENEQGPALTDPKRNYKDDNHKPEILRALTPFAALKGFRQPKEIYDYFTVFSPDFASLNLSSLITRPEDIGLRLFYESLLELDKDVLSDLCRRALKAFRPNEFPEGRWLGQLAEQYPGDPGILAPLYLNLIELQPGDAIFLQAGELHAYLQGTGVELMANSDNVLRAGLTVKHKDPAELLSVVRFASSGREPVHPDTNENGWQVYFTPSEEFRLHWVNVSEECPRTFFSEGPAVALCLEGTLNWSGEGDLTLRAGESLFIPAGAGPLNISGSGSVAAAVVP